MVTAISYPSRPVPFSQGSQLFIARTVLTSTPESVWKIEAGFVRTMTWLDDGTIIVLGIWGAGDVVGQPLSSANPYQIECLTRVEATCVPKVAVDNLEHVLMAQLHYTEQLMVIRGSRRVDEMLLKLLSWLADRFGTTTQKGRLLDLRLTHQDLSEFLGATRVTVTRVLSQLERQGYIERLSLQRIVLQREDVWHYEI